MERLLSEASTIDLTLPPASLPPSVSNPNQLEFFTSTTPPLVNLQIENITLWSDIDNPTASASLASDSSNFQPGSDTPESAQPPALVDSVSLQSSPLALAPVSAALPTLSKPVRSTATALADPLSAPTSAHSVNEFGTQPVERKSVYLPPNRPSADRSATLAVPDDPEPPGIARDVSYESRDSTQASKSESIGSSVGQFAESKSKSNVGSNAFNTVAPAIWTPPSNEAIIKALREELKMSREAERLAGLYMAAGPTGEQCFEILSFSIRIITLQR